MKPTLIEKKELYRRIIIQDKIYITNLGVIKKSLKITNYFTFKFFLQYQIFKFLQVCKCTENLYKIMAFRISFFSCYIEIILKNFKKFLLKKIYSHHNYELNLSLDNCLFTFFDKSFRLIEYTGNIFCFLDSIYLEKLTFFNIYDIKNLIFKTNMVKIDVFMNSFLNYSYIVNIPVNYTIIYKTFKKFIKLILNLAKKFLKSDLTIYRKSKNIFLKFNLSYDFKKVLNRLVLKYYNKTDYLTFDFLFIFLIRNGFRFYDKNLHIILTKKKKNLFSYFSFLTNFFFWLNFKKTYKKTVFFTRQTYCEIFFFNKRSFKFWFFLLKKKNYEEIFTCFKFFIWPYNIKIIKYHFILFYHKKDFNFQKILNFSKWSSIQLLKKNYYTIEKKKFFLFSSLFVNHWKSYINFSFNFFEKFLFLEYIFNIREFFFVHFSLNFFYNLNIVCLSSIIGKKNFKKKLIEYLYFALDFIIIKKENKNLKEMGNYIYLISKEIVFFIAGKYKFFNFENQFIKSRLFIFLYHFSINYNKHKIKYNIKSSILESFPFNINNVENRFDLGNVIDKYTKNLCFFLQRMDAIIYLKSKFNVMCENKKDKISIFNLLIKIKYFINNFKKTCKIKKFYLPILIFRSFKFISRMYYFYYKKEKIINWKFTLTRFLIQVIGLICNKKKFFFFHTTFEQMLLCISFNLNSVIFKKDLKFIMQNLRSKVILYKRTKKKLIVCCILEIKRLKHIEFLVINKFFYPKKKVKWLSVNTCFILLEKKICFFNLSNYLDKESIYLSQSLITKILKKINKLKIVNLLVLVKEKMDNNLNADPRGIKLQIQELIKKEYIKLASKKKTCKYNFY